MYEIVLKGFIETGDPDSLVTELKDVIEKHSSELVGQFNVFQLAPFVDYQKIESTQDSNSDL